MRLTPFLRTCTVLAGDNIHAGRGRTGYLILTVAIMVGAWLTLSAMAAPFLDNSESVGSGVTVTNGNQAHAPLPLRYANRLEAIPGARDVAWFTLQLVDCKQAPEVTVTLNVFGGPGTAANVAGNGVDVAAMQRWNADPAGILITRGAATDCGWRTGQGVNPPDVVGKNVPLHVSGVMPGAEDVAFAHFDYINRVAPLSGKDTVLRYLASGGGARGDELLAARIESEFAHDFPTVSATTNTTVQNAWARFGKVQQLIAFVMAAILLCAASVLMSVLAHTAAQRRAKFALLQVLGFRRGTLFSAMVLELLVIAIVGALLGTGFGKLVEHLMPVSIRITFGGFAIPARAWWWMPLWLALLVMAALAWPAALVSRARPIDYRAI